MKLDVVLIYFGELGLENEALFGFVEIHGGGPCPCGRELPLGAPLFVRDWTLGPDRPRAHAGERGQRAREVLRTNFSATSRVTRAAKLTQAASRHSYRWCNPPTRGSTTTFAVGDGRCVTALKLGVSLFSPKWQRSS